VSHILSARPGWTPRTVRPYAAVKVEVIAKGKPPKLLVTPHITILRAGELIRELPPEVIVTDGTEVLAASGKFFITIETIDPFHLLVDALDGNRPF
jgi:hypothetical protein